jgi:hypothetical protein
MWYNVLNYHIKQVKKACNTVSLCPRKKKTHSYYHFECNCALIALILDRINHCTAVMKHVRMWRNEPDQIMIGFKSISVAELTFSPFPNASLFRVVFLFGGVLESFSGFKTKIPKM